MKTTIKHLDFFKASRLALRNGGRLRFSSTKCADWCRFKYVEGGGARLVLVEGIHGWWWPSFKQMESEKWEVSFEEKPEIFVWGVCDPETGHSSIFREKPVFKDNAQEWDAIADDYDCDRMYLHCENVFPKDVPVKLRLVPVAEDET